MTTYINHILSNKALRFVGLMLVMGMFFGVLSNNAQAQSTPPANTTIGNQATATYQDNGGNPRTVTSNTVETVVQQVAGVFVTAGLTKAASPGGDVSFPHTITNNGNGTDSFNLSALDAGGGDFAYGDIFIYADGDGNGVPDDFNPITTTPNIDAGDSYGIVIVASVPAGATQAQTADIDLTVTSVFDGNISDTATNTASIEEAAVISVQKSASSSTANTGDTITYTLTFSNTGNSPGTNLTIKDPIPAGFTYVANSGVWSSGSPITDASGGDASGIAYEFKTGGIQDSVIATIANLNSGTSGTLKFDVTIDNGTEGQTLTNTASYIHDDLDNPTNTNGASVVVNQNFSVSIVGNQNVDQGPVNQGATVNFVNTFVNDGTTTDRYNITLGSDNYPSGRTFTLFKTDGSGNPTSPFTDTNSDGIPDTGPVAAGDNITIILQVSLPSGASGTGPFTVDKTLTSVNDGAQSAVHTDRLNGINAATVDLTNDAPASDAGTQLGEGKGAEENPVQTKSTNPGTTISFDLYATNTGAQADNYGLAFGIDTTAAGALASPGTLPTGWSVQFRDPANGNSVVTGTGSIAAGANKRIVAEVTIPAGASPVTAQDLYFRVLSSTTSSTDIIHDAVTVNTQQNVSLTSGNSGQIFPGGSRRYQHTFTVNSNIDENDGTNSAFQVTLANSEANGFTSQVYWDKNGDGIVTTGQPDPNDNDVLITTAAGGTASFPAGIGTLQFGDQVNFIVRVTAGTGVSDNTTNTTTFTVSDNVGPIADQINQDITTVVAGLLTIDKFQAPDDNGSAGTFVKTQLSSAPGDTVYYKITVSNDGSESVSSVVISDNIPSFTKQLGAVSVDASGTAQTVTIASEPGDGNTGTVQITVPSLASGESFEFTFAVKVDS